MGDRFLYTEICAKTKKYYSFSLEYRMPISYEVAFWQSGQMPSTTKRWRRI